MAGYFGLLIPEGIRQMISSDVLADGCFAEIAGVDAVSVASTRPGCASGSDACERAGEHCHTMTVDLPDYSVRSAAAVRDVAAQPAGRSAPASAMASPPSASAISSAGP